MRKILTFVIVCLLISQLAFAYDESEKTPKAMEETILRLLNNPIQDAITGHYGQPRQFVNDKLLSIKKIPKTSNYELVVQAETFFGPHNPPYGIETITFVITRGQVRLNEFVHHDEGE